MLDLHRGILELFSAWEGMPRREWDGMRTFVRPGRPEPVPKAVRAPCPTCGLSMGRHAIFGCRPLGGLPPILPRTRGLSTSERRRRVC
jgi:hypothetical protein